jgi:hypothetical protein
MCDAELVHLGVINYADRWLLRRVQPRVMSLFFQFKLSTSRISSAEKPMGVRPDSFLIRYHVSRRLIQRRIIVDCRLSVIDCTPEMAIKSGSDCLELIDPCVRQL